jgi:aminomethyltransferase
LEAGLCLYGHELNQDISPIEAVLGWTITKRRKEQGGFLGYDTVKRHLE